MIVVTGATGNVGRPLVQALVAAGEEVTAVSRRITAEDVPAGVHVRQGDLADPGSVGFEGAKAVFLLTAGDFLGSGGDLGAVVARLRAAGVPRVVLLSSQGVGTGHHPSGMEDAVTGSGLEWTVLRGGAFAANALQWADSVRTDRTVAAPFGDVGVPVVDTADLADVAATVLREPGHAGQVYELTGPVSLSPREQAAIIGAVLGDPVRFVEVSRAEAKATMVRYMADRVADTTLDILGAPGDLAKLSPDVERVLGRPARPFADWVIRNAAAFR